MSFNSFSKTFSFNVYLLTLALLKPAATVRNTSWKLFVSYWETFSELANNPY